jgi:hypothetical protein
MLKRRLLIGVSVALMTGMVLLSLGIFSAQAAPPATNDDFDAATIISGLPFSDSILTTEATLAYDDPLVCGGQYATVWYRFTPTTNVGVKTDTAGSSYSTSIAVFTGSRGSLGWVTNVCNSGTVAFQASAGTTYYFMVSGFSGGPYPPPSGSDLSLVFNVTEIPAPANDNFANATIIDALPFSQSVDTAYATTEANEPSPSCGGMRNTIWYSFTPATSSSYTVDASAGTGVTVGAYQGASLSDLVTLGCFQRQWGWGGPLTLHLEADTTYYFQASMTGYEWNGWVINFSLNFAPPPNVDFGFWPSDPNTFETVQFNNYSNDPGGVGLTITSWNFGDGTRSQDWNPTHRFTKDGDYTVRLDETTSDGRTGTISKHIQVRTHDVVITKFTVPQSASAGQTRSITVEINNQRYPETVEVQLFKSTPNGYVLVGYLTQSVPVRPSNRTTSFAFSYTFTTEDAAIGRVTFRAVANLVGARDALPANNEAIALPTKVAR